MHCISEGNDYTGQLIRHAYVWHRLLKNSWTFSRYPVIILFLSLCFSTRHSILIEPNVHIFQICHFVKFAHWQLLWNIFLEFSWGSGNFLVTCNITNGDVLQLSHYTFLPLIWVWVTEIVTVKLLSNPTRWRSETPSWFRNRLNHFTSNNQLQPRISSYNLESPATT